ncbi:MAG: hypothetical protein MUC76_06690 [Spirochaetes bacterium]|jgi:hypothetical protein|nr:hypothetical protein [Spirochaetota bacterium]
MIQSDGDLRNWKQEQLNYFKGYLDNFRKDSREYKLLLEGIRELENSL